MVEEKYCNPNKFEPRLQIPKSGNSFYNRKASGKGYSNAIQGKGKDSKPCSGLEVLPNCVGWATSRFAEILNDTSFKYLKPVNAENFIQYADKSLKVGKEPKLGACMVFSKGKQGVSSDGAGHVAIVEKIVSSTEIVTSESGWQSKPFWTQTRKKGKDGNWGQSSSYKFLGFIYNPAPSCQDSNFNFNISSNSNKPTKVIEKKATQTAKKINKNLSGTYEVIANDGLNIRDGAGIDFDSLGILPKGTKIKSYGYYNVLENTKWLYVQCTYDNIKYIGFCSESWLKKI